MYEYSESFFVSVQGVPLGPRGPQVMRHPVWAQGSDQGPCIHALAPSYGTTFCHLTHSSKIPPCLLTQLLAPSFSSRRCAGDSRRRRLNLELYNPSKGKRLLKMNVRAILSLCWNVIVLSSLYASCYWSLSNSRVFARLFRYVMEVIQRGRTAVRPAMFPPLSVVPAVSDSELSEPEYAHYFFPAADHHT